MISFNKNPWFAIWYKPRSVIKQILDTKITPHIFILPVLGGIYILLSKAITRNIGDLINIPTILFTSVIFGPLLGFIWVYVLSGLLTWSGQWIGGRGSYKELRIAVTWSLVPLVWSLFLLLIPQIIMFGRELFSSQAPPIDTNNAVRFLIRNGFELSEFVVILWSVAIFLKCVGEAHHFSVWKALLNTVLAFTLVFLFGLILILMVRLFI